MSYHDTNYRKYTRMSSNGPRKMSNKEMIEEAVDTVKIGKRKTVYGKDTLESFFKSGCIDQSLCREGLIDMQNGLEMLLKGIVEYYGESYAEEHYTVRNGELLEDLTREIPELRELHDAFGILQDDDFSFMMYKCSKFPRYQTFKTNRNFRNLMYKLSDLLIKFSDNNILNKD